MESNSEYLSNEVNKPRFHFRNDKICPVKIQNSRCGIYIYFYFDKALKNGHFANDLGFRRNQFCWVRDVRLLLGFKFHNFSNQYVSVAKENAFDQF